MRPNAPPLIKNGINGVANKPAPMKISHQFSNRIFTAIFFSQEKSERMPYTSSSPIISVKSKIFTVLSKLISFSS